MNLKKEICNLEKSLIENQDISDEGCAELERQLIALLVSEAGLEGKKIKSIEHFISSSQNVAKDKLRRIAILLTRYLSDETLYKILDSKNDFSRKFVELYFRELPDFAKKFKLDQRKQTFETMKSIQEVHSSVLNSLQSMRVLRPEIQSISANRTEIAKALKTNINKNYLAPFAPEGCVELVLQILNEIDYLDNSENDDLFDRMRELEKTLTDEISVDQESYSFFLNDIYYPFINCCLEALKSLKETNSKRMSCVLQFTKQTRNLAEKSYPLYEEGRELIFTIPIENKGPGKAVDVKVTVSERDENIALNPVYEIGALSPGKHFLALEALVAKRCDKTEFEITVNYKDRSSNTSKEICNTCEIRAQKDTVDWERLTRKTPYSTEVAIGEDFVGRSKSLIQLSSRCLKDTMQSSYIHGQKRIGKTSLAKAVLTEIERESSNTYTHYIEWGDISSPDPEATINELGENLVEFLSGEIQNEIFEKEIEFKGSLVPLNKIATKLLRSDPEKRFVIALDEFDELQPELYRHGKYADPFFANLRTLSSKQNMCFLLVGGESMPYIISAQGDQLNKYVPESLDFFSREDVLTDYKDLIVNPVSDSIVWTDEAIQYLFELTNGHPYYTKLICSDAYERAVEYRDTDITSRELESWVGKLVEKLDVNSFLHHWTDGIQSRSPEDRELTIDKRQRVLVGIGKCIQQGEIATTDAIMRQVSSSKIHELEVAECVKDFEKRQILYTKDGEVKVLIKLFQKWLVNTGVSKITGDQFTDDLIKQAEVEKQKLYVSDYEIETVIEEWGPYRTSEISCTQVRAWLDQVEEHRDQRALFKILRGLCFISGRQMRVLLNDMHDSIKKHFPGYVQTKRNQKRNDLFIVYIDGEGKSGQRIANTYVDENNIPVKNISGKSTFSENVEKYEGHTGTTLNGAIIVDDFIGSGESMLGNLKHFLEENRAFILERSLTVAVMAMTSTSDGKDLLEQYAESVSDIKIVVKVGRIVDEVMVFKKSCTIWKNEEERAYALSLTRKLGEKLNKQFPLGYNNQGLALVFSDNCPNNSLPILHTGTNKAGFLWKPLFERIMK